MVSHPPVRDYDEPFHYARAAMILIGEPSHKVALEFCRHPKPFLRESGAYLLGVLNMQRSQSVSALLALLDDRNVGVRSEAYAALSQFPSADVESRLLPRLRQFDPAESFDAAYALHTGSTNAHIQMLDAYAESSNLEFRASILSALSLLDRPETSQECREKSYLDPCFAFQNSRAAFRPLVAHPSAEQAFLRIRSNILSGKTPRVFETLFELNPELNGTVPPTFPPLDGSPDSSFNLLP